MPSEPSDGIAGNRPFQSNQGKKMKDQDFDLDNLDKLLDDFDGVTVEGGVDSENDDGCEGGACKI
ncbi:hypothetical protein [Neisseria polysaccharea]|uniref:Uncharacterized protein n=2 Tax=Neisseria flavescens TaxID=484 RepID=C0ENL4_NEIFL|nr:hypothetical protein [Neisseria polysaccharea]EEG33391.1 hypothetical protein NEIFLAOT_01549 [Neisseria flavescens NRL30031/H210]